MRSGEDVIRDPLLALDGVESFGLQVEHRPVTPAERHQLVVRAELDRSAVLEHADAVGVAHGREAVGDQDGRGLAGGSEDAVDRKSVV